MKPGLPRRQILLFLVAITFPCVVVVALGLRLVAQDRELTEKRAADERRRIVNDIRRELAAHLERIRASALASPGRDEPALAFATVVRDGRLALPWDDRANRLEALLARSSAAALIQAGERAEFTGNLEEAIRWYRGATAAPEPAVAAWSRCLLARALAKSGRQREADALDEAVARLPFEFTDGHGMPLALYAGKRLSRRPRSAMPSFYAAHYLDMLKRHRWLPPTTLYMIRDVMEVEPASDVADGVRHIVAERLTAAEHVEALAADAATLVARARSRGSESRWYLHADSGWLLNAASGSSGDVAVTAVVAERAVGDLPPPPGAVSIRWAREGPEEPWNPNADLTGRISPCTLENATNLISRIQGTHAAGVRHHPP